MMEISLATALKAIALVVAMGVPEAEVASMATALWGWVSMVAMLDSAWKVEALVRDLLLRRAHTPKNQRSNGLGSMNCRMQPRVSSTEASCLWLKDPLLKPSHDGRLRSHPGRTERNPLSHRKEILLEATPRMSGNSH
jgi:hypothetical protein